MLIIIFTKYSSVHQAIDYFIITNKIDIYLLHLLLL